VSLNRWLFASTQYTKITSSQNSRNGDFIQINFGGFVSLSTIDWRGKSVCSVFLRGCPLRCSYCQNEEIQAGEDWREIEEIFAMIQSSVPFISGVIFSGGEPTMQKEGLIALAQFVKKLNLAVGIQTNGFFPDTLESLIFQDLVDKIAIDYKTTWEGYSGIIGGYYPMVKENYERNVLKSIGICKKAVEKKKLDEFEVVFTIFYENQEYLMEISKKIGDVPLVLQQGEHKIGMMRTTIPEMTNGEYIWKKRIQQENHPPLKLNEIKEIADKLEKSIRIRTREIGEISYEGYRRRRSARKW
jgi:pyruvate formate lyase activating enzyme